MNNAKCPTVPNGSRKLHLVVQWILAITEHGLDARPVAPVYTATGKNPLASDDREQTVSGFQTFGEKRRALTRQLAGRLHAFRHLARRDVFPDISQKETYSRTFGWKSLMHLQNWAETDGLVA